jgi:hypothetical protein
LVLKIFFNYKQKKKAVKPLKQTPPCPDQDGGIRVQKSLNWKFRKPKDPQNLDGFESLLPEFARTVRGNFHKSHFSSEGALP